MVTARSSKAIHGGSGSSHPSCFGEGGWTALTDRLPTCSLLSLQSTTALPSATVNVLGAVAGSATFSAAEIAAMSRTKVSAAFHSLAGKYAGVTMNAYWTDGRR
jgi:hypothetical protein